MSADREKVLQLACELFVGLGFAMCQADGVLQRDEGRALAKALNQLLDKMQASKELREQVPGMLTRASKACARKGDAASAEARLQQLLELGRRFDDSDRRMFLESLMLIAESDGEVHELERALITRIESAWAIRDAAASGGDPPASAPTSRASEGEAVPSEDLLAAAIHAWTTMSVIDGDQAASEIEAALQFIVQLGLLLGLSAEEVVNDRLMESFLQAGVRAQAGMESLLEAYRQNLETLAGAPRPVRKHVLTGLAVIALKHEKIVSEEAALLAVAEQILKVDLKEITGEARRPEAAVAEESASAPATSSSARLPSAETLRGLRAHLDEGDALIEHWWLADAGRDDTIKPTYAWAVGYPVVELTYSDRQGSSSFVSWSIVEGLSLEQLRGSFTVPGYSALGLMRPDEDLRTVVSMGEHWIRAATLRVTARDPRDNGWGAALAHLALAHPKSLVAPGPFADAAPIVLDAFKFPLEFLDEQPRLRRIVDGGRLKALIVGFPVRSDSPASVNGLPDGAADICFTLGVTDEVPEELAQLELFVSLYARMQRRYVAPSRGQPSSITPAVAHSFERLSDWCGLDLQGLPPANSGSMTRAEMQAVHQDVYDRAGALQLASQV